MKTAQVVKAAQVVVADGLIVVGLTLTLHGVHRCFGAGVAFIVGGLLAIVVGIGVAVITVPQPARPPLPRRRNEEEEL